MTPFLVGRGVLCRLAEKLSQFILQKRRPPKNGVNVKMTLATPTWKGTFLALLAGSLGIVFTNLFFCQIFLFLGAGGSVGLIMKRIMDDFGLELYDVFLAWLIIFLPIAIVKIVIWTPVRMPPIKNDDEYSIFQHSIMLKPCLGTKSENIEVVYQI